MPQQQFKGYTEDQMKRIASKLGHKGDLNTFDGYLKGNPKAMNKFNSLNDSVTRRYAQGGDVSQGGYAHSATGGVVKANTGRREPHNPNDTYARPMPAIFPSITAKPWYPNKPTFNDPATKREAVSEGISYNADTTVGQTTVNQSLKPTLPTDTATEVSNIRQDTNQLMDSDAGQVSNSAPTAGTTIAGTSTAATPKQMRANTVDTATAATAVNNAMAGVNAAQGTVSEEMQAEQGRLSSGATADTQKGNAAQVGNTADLRLQRGETVQGAEGETASSTAATQNRVRTTTAAQLNGNIPTAIAATEYKLEDTQAARMASFEVATPARLGSIPEAQAAQSYAKSGVRAQQREIADKELVDVAKQGLQMDSTTAVAATMSTLDRAAVTKAAKGTFSQELAQPSQGTVDAASTVQGQMSSLMNQFNDGTPAWAAGAMRSVNAQMAARGIGSSSMASSALLQTAMESALPIAQADAQVYATMGMQNLNNRQQTSLSNAAAMQGMTLQNLNNEQQTALQNSSKAFELQSANLSNQQSVVLANQQVAAAAQGKNLDVKTQVSLTNAAKFAEVNNINLNNRQQANLAASSENLSVDMANLSNTQQTALSNLQVRAALRGQDLSNEQQAAMLNSTQSFESSQFDATNEQQAFMQDAAAEAALKGQVLSNQQQTALFNVSSQLSERELNLTNDQQTRLFNTTQASQADMANLSNRQQTALANAQIDAAVKGQELNNKQQANVLNAARIGEIANTNFTADQQKSLQNAQLTQTMNIENLSNSQATALANAATVANMDLTNLNNRQQAAVQNAKSFLDMDMANLTNDQQTTLFKAQQRTSALLSDTAAKNASKQFNASSENQTDQFFSNLSSNVSQFNASQKNAQNKFNAGELTATSKFNTEVKNQREQFNAKNSLVIEQSNAQWRRSTATADTVAVNRANEINAKALLDISNTAYNNLWQAQRDEMDWAYEIAEGEANRFTTLAAAAIEAESASRTAGEAADTSFWGDIFEFGTKVYEHWD